MPSAQVVLPPSVVVVAALADTSFVVDVLASKVTVFKLKRIEINNAIMAVGL